MSGTADASSEVFWATFAGSGKFVGGAVSVATEAASGDNTMRINDRSNKRDAADGWLLIAFAWM